MSTTEDTTREILGGGELVYRVTDPSLLRFSDTDGATPVVEGRMMPYDEWAEVNSSIEGHFFERFAPGSLAKTMSERGQKIRVLFEHGLDTGLGRQAIAELEELRDEPDGAYFRASLLDGLPPLLVAGLRRGLYGSSVRFHPVKAERVRFPERSDYNPDGLEERTVLEGHIREVSLTAFPAYEGATAQVRSLTDEVAARQLLASPDRLVEIIQANHLNQRVIDPYMTEPQHSGREDPADPGSERSRSTQPTRDYLKPEEADPEWLL